MQTDECVLAATGGSPTLGPVLIIGILLVLGGSMVLSAKRRRRGAAAVVALAVIVAASLLVPTTPASAATGSGPCAQAQAQSPAPTATPSPTTTPSVPPVFPDLSPIVIAPVSPADVTSSDLVFTLRNEGEGATTAPIEATIVSTGPAGMALSFQPDRTIAVVDGVDHAVANASFEVTGSGTEAEPFVVRTDEVLTPGATVAFSLTVGAPAAGACQPGSVTIDVVPGTGGGETPATNNTDTAPFSFAPVRSDKSATDDTDGDGVADACDLDSDNDGILDSLEDVNNNGLYKDDDKEGDLLFIAELGDSIPNYQDLDSDNDGILDLMEGLRLTPEELDLYDADSDGVFDSDLSFGRNGLLDALETYPDSGELKPALLPLRDADRDELPDYIDLKSNGSDLDLYVIGKDSLDELGGGFLYPIDDTDRDGIQTVVDTALDRRGAPGSPRSPFPLP